MTSNSDRIMNDLRLLKPRLKDWGITRLRVFGSVLHGDAGPESDIDLIADFDQKKPSYFRFIDIRDEIAVILDKKIDLFTEASLDSYIRDRVIAEACDV